MLSKFLYLFYKKRGFDCIAKDLIADAFIYLKKAHSYNRLDREVGLVVAKIYIDEKLYGEAGDTLQLYENFEDAEYLTALGSLYESQGDIDKSFDLYSNIILNLVFDSDVEWYEHLLRLITTSGHQLKKTVLRFFDDLKHAGFTPQGLYYSGVFCTHIDEPKKAISFLREAKDEMFDSYLCCQALGSAFYQLKDSESAHKYFYEALSFNLNKVEPYINLGKAFENTDSSKAKAFFEQALAIKEDFNALCGLANIEHERGNNDQALKLLERAEDINPNSKECAFSLGELYLIEENFDEAIYYFELALSRDNVFVEACIKLASTLEKIGMVDEALERSKQFFLNHKSSLTPSFYINLSFLSEKLKNLDASIQYLKKGVDHFPADHQLLNTYSVQLRESGELGLALEYIDQALAVLPGEVNYLSNKAAILADLGSYELSQEFFDKAEILDSQNTNTLWQRAIVYLKYYNFRLGWECYEERWKKIDDNQKRPFTFPSFNKSYDGATLLVYSEQGLGDEIMFSSCLKDFSRYSSNIVLECDPKLEKLFRRSFDFADIYASSDRNNIGWLQKYPKIEQQIAIGSIPKYVRNSLEDFEKKSPFLIVDKGRKRYWVDKLNELGEGIKIGISWKGGTYKTRKNLRCIDLPSLAELLKVKGVNFINLQYGDVQDDLDALEALSGSHVHNFSEAINDYDETAALCCALDVVVSVQTAIVHLCGALGVPVWCMLPEVAEWRYGVKGSTMPWYESVKLFRQKGCSEWAPVMNDVEKQLEELRGEA